MSMVTRERRLTRGLPTGAEATKPSRPVVVRRRSARIDRFRSPKVTHTKNTICPRARKMASDIIHAEGVRLAVPSSAPSTRNLLSSRHALVQQTSQPGVAVLPVRL